MPGSLVGDPFDVPKGPMPTRPHPTDFKRFVRERPEAPRWRPERWRGAVVRLARTEAVSGALITAAVIAALAWSNLAPASYRHLWVTHAAVALFPHAELSTLRQWVDNGLMVVFFFAAGLEIGRERWAGSLRDNRNAVLPVVAAAGGMLGAAVVYLTTSTLAGAGPAVQRGWGVPMATDVAFTLGAMALLGRRVPSSLRVFVLALAVADDIGSVIVLAVVSASHVRVWALVAFNVWLAALVGLRLIARRAWWPWAAATVAGWALLAWAGVEPSLAGAFCGMAVPVASAHGRPGPSGRLENATAPIAALGVLPLFALANTGVSLHLATLTQGPSRAVTVAIVCARLLGKVIGITGATAALVLTGVVGLPTTVRWRQLAGAAAMCGMGFTVPLLFATSAFGGHVGLLSAAKLGLLLGTAVSGVGGALLIATSRRAQNTVRRR